MIVIRKYMESPILIACLKPCLKPARYLACFLVMLFTGVRAQAQAPQVQANRLTPKDSIVQLYNDKALKLLNEGRFDECRQLVGTALKVEENPVSYCLLSHISNVEQNWDDAIKYGKLAMKANPNFVATYNELFSAYFNAQQWKDAVDVIEYSEKLNVSGFSKEQKQTLEYALENQQNSHIITFCFLLIVFGIFCIPIFNAYKTKVNYFNSGSEPRLTEAFILGGMISCALYSQFFAYSKWIWSFNPHYPTYEFAPNMRISIFEHDGIETFVLYLLMLANISITLMVMPLLLRLKSNKVVYMIIVLALFFITGYYFHNIGFFPPIPAIDKKNIFLPVFLTLLSVGLYVLYQKNTLLSRIAILVLVAFSGLISAGPASLFDLMFILDPALRLIHGFKVSEIYFQYDLFLSFLAVAWMKMNWSIESFPYLGQLSFFLFFVASFFYGERFFKTRGLAVLFIIALVLVRYYSVWADIPTILQATPLRLDLWLIVLFVAYRKGIYHWSVGLCLGLLVLFHRNLGLLYLSSYVELLFGIFILDLVVLIRDQKWNMTALKDLLIKHLKSSAVNLGIIVASIGLCFVMFHELFSKSATIYRSLGVGMIPISRLSFFWYVPVLLSCVILFIVYYRDKLGTKYTHAALFIVLLVISNSMYFYGRSHENNILNASAIIIYAIFLLFDLLIYLAPDTGIILTHVAEKVKPQAKAQSKPQGKQAKQPPAQVKPETVLETPRSFNLTWKMASLALPFLFVVLTSYYYCDRIATKSEIQFENLAKFQFSYPFTETPVDTATVRRITHNSSKVYFLDYYFDFYHYYYGGYVPQGYFSPCATWVFKKDVINFVQDLIDKGYYIVYNVGDYGYFGEYFVQLNYNQSFQYKNFVALSKQDVPLLLPETLPSVYHIGIRDSLAQNGIDYKGIQLKDEFTIELIVKPFRNQVPGAVILNNMSKTDGIKGFTLQRNGNNGIQYGFGFGNGTSSMTSVFFPLEEEKWHYLVLTVNKQSVKVYDNGTLLVNGNAAGMSFVNNDFPLTIGNQSATRDTRFTGYIREVKISNGNLNEADISANVQKLVKEISPN